MNIKPFLEKLTENWPAKAICLVAACFLCIFNQYSSLEQRSVPVSLDVTQDGEMICTTHIPSSVSVTIKTSSENIGHVSPDGIVAKLDLSYYAEEGNFDAPVFVELPANLKVLDPLQVTVIPENIRVHLERNVAKSVKVAPKSVGEVPYGYTVESLSSEPGYIEIYGPRSLVESLKFLPTEEIVVDDRTATFSETRKVMNLDRLVKIIGEGEVSVTAEIGYQQGVKSFERFPVSLSNLAENLKADSSYYVDFSISGSQLNLDEYEPQPYTISANLESVTQAGEYDVPITVLLPQHFKLESISQEAIKILVSEIPVQQEENSEAEVGSEE